jgi:hypothetical protein
MGFFLNQFAACQHIDFMFQSGAAIVADIVSITSTCAL